MGPANGTIASPAPSTQLTSVIAVEGDVSTAGCATWWRLSGGIDVEALHVAWVAAGLDASWLPEPPTDRAALRRAVRAHEERRLLARPLDSRDGWVLVRERITQYPTPATLEAAPADVPAGAAQNMEWTPLLRATLVEATETESSRVDIDFLVEPTEELTQVGVQIQEDYAAHLGRLAPENVSAWLADVTAKVDAVALRDTGGVYFVPNNMVPTWRQVAAVLRAASAHVIYELPALKTENAVEAILSAIETEATKAAEDMESFEDLGIRGLTRREARCRGVEAKVAGYEALLGRSLDGLRERLEKLRANLAIAIMAAREDATTPEAA